MSTRKLVGSCTQDPMQVCDLILLDAHIHKEHSLRGGTRSNAQRWLLPLLLTILIVCIVLIAAVSAHLVNRSGSEPERQHRDFG